MSWQTQNWAGERRGLSPQAKLILIGMASCSDAQHEAYPSVGWLIEWSGLERKTVLKWLAAMSDPEAPGGALIEDTGQRRGRSLQIKVWRLKVASEGAIADPAALQKSDAKPSAKIVPKTGQSQKREHPKNGERQSQKRDTEPFLGTNTLSTPDGVDAPRRDLDQDLLGEAAPPPPDPAGRDRPHRLPADWEAPPLADLAPEARALAAQWPNGAYAAYAANFRGYWTEVEPKRRTARGWAATFANWVIRVHSDVMRAGKAGISFAPSTPAKPAAARAVQPVAALAHEGPAGLAIRAALRGVLGAQISATWLDPAAFLINGDVLDVIAPSEFQRGWIEDRFAAQIKAAAGPAVRTIRFSTETPSTPAKGQ